jgi:hypothetical protein
MLKDLLDPKPMRSSESVIVKQETLAGAKFKGSRLTETLREYVKELFESEEAYKLTTKITKRKDSDINYFSKEEKENIVISFALRFSPQEILEVINEARVQRGEPTVIIQNINFYRVAYQDLIDQIWAFAAVRIGDLYSYADKVHRIGKLNELAESLRNKVMARIYRDDFSKSTLDIGNFYLRTMAVMNNEVGGKSLHDMIKLNPPQLPEKEEENPLTEEELREAVKQEIHDRFRNQLPKKSSIKELPENVITIDSKVS